MSTVTLRDGNDFKKWTFTSFSKIPFFPTDGFIDWFVSKEIINNRTGKWFFGVVSLDPSFDMTAIKDKGSCKENDIGKKDLSEDFLSENYDFQAYTSGCYYFNKSFEVWEAIGVTVG